MKTKKSKTFQIITLDWVVTDSIAGFPDKSGVYQVYGDSSIYGTSCLLYIGQSKNLAARRQQHENDSPISYQNNVSFRYALCDIELLDIAESLLISTHKPSMNGMNLKEPCERSVLYMVQNHGERGVLTLQVTNSYWVPDA